MVRFASIAGLVVVGLMATASARAETMNYKADLRADTEVPPNPSKGVGHVTATYDTDSKKLSWKVGYSDLTGPALRGVVLGLLALDGVLSAIFAALLLPIRIGTFPFPISAVISGALNAVLVWAGLQWTASGRLGAIALWAWLLTVGALALGGPDGDVVFGGPGFDEYAPMVLLILGVLPPAALLWRRARQRASD